MADESAGIRRLLDRAYVYRLLQDAVGSNRSHARFVSEYVKPKDGDRILDLGCGPGHILLALPPDVDYVGVDSSPDYIREARTKWGTRGEFRLADGRDPLSSDAPFDIVLVMGLLHHLDDAGCTIVFRNAATALARSGRLVTIEPACARSQSRVAGWLIAWDRGQYIRTAEDYAERARASFGSVMIDVRTDLLRVPYTHAVLTCSRPKQ
jgi:SAM-dependent methyltransferase